MRLKILKNEPKELRLEVEGEGHTFCNVVQEALLEEKSVDFAGYSLPHPLVSNPFIYVRSKGRITATRVLERALKKLERKIGEFNEEFNKSWENSD
jgi:DNA-directed RNA polymerase subunit L